METLVFSFSFLSLEYEACQADLKKKLNIKKRRGIE